MEILATQVEELRDNPDPTDAALALQSRENEDAFALLYYRYRDRIYRYLKIRIGSDDDARDLTQQTFLRAFDNIARYTERRGTFASWLFAIARNLSVDFQRGKRLTIHLDALDIPAPGDLEEEGIARADFVQMRRLLGTLPDHKREILTLRFAGDLTVPEIAMVVGKSPDAVHKMLARTLQDLRSEL